jgi:hypothetical protein
MKLKSLILGSVAAVGLSTAGFAADLGVLTSLDVCDELGLSGLTISSDTNCLQISGGVSYEFAWGDFRHEHSVAHTEDSGARNVSNGDDGLDWTSKVEAWLKFVGTASSDFGPAKAVIKIKEVDITRIQSGFGVVAPYVADTDGEADGLFIDEAYVQIGDTTVIMAGKKGSIANLGDDEPFNYLGLFHSDDIDGKGVGIDGDYSGLGGHVIQVVSDLGNGVNVGIGLENLNGSSFIGDVLPAAGDPAFTHGTLVGVISYAGENITAHVTGAAFGILDGDVESWAIHAGATGTFDAFKIRGAVSYWDDKKFVVGRDVLNALLSVEGNFDMFKIALSGEYEYSDLDGTGDFGVGGSIGATVTEGVSINLGGRYFFDDLTDEDTYHVAAQLVAAVTETIKITGEIGGYFGDGVTLHNHSGDPIYYGSAELAWAPGGGFTSSLKGEVNSEEAYKVTFKAAKTFE